MTVSQDEMVWELSHRAEPFSRAIADRHYNRQSIGAANFVPPGRCVVLKAKTPTGQALWVTSWPFAEYVKHEWAGAWVCSAFRNEGAGVASALIWQALAATRHIFGDPPELGLVTFINRKMVRPIMVRGKPTWARTWTLCGFQHVGFTKSGLDAYQLLPSQFPQPCRPIGAQGALFEMERAS